MPRERVFRRNGLRRTVGIGRAILALALLIGEAGLRYGLFVSHDVPAAQRAFREAPARCEASRPTPGCAYDVCLPEARYVRKLSLFGSVLRQDFRPDSDVDVLVEFEPDHVPGFIALHEMEEELSRLLGGRMVDLVTERFLNRRIRDRVLAAAQVQYAAG